ncbi:MAG TPA: hypothetical protein VD735_07730, partial [Candidatus Saccharimonadales bacterium]|nr:hypothetical protein [Candidatus Saccharimonadales bacterium]
MSETLTIVGDIAERERLELEQLWQLPAVVPQHEQPPAPERQETYAHSLRVISKLGALAAANLLQTPEGVAARKELQEEFESSVAEMIKTDVEFRGVLEINREDTYAIKDGKVLAYDGKTPVVDMIATGVEASAKEALKDKRMCTQANRDAADLRNAHAVDAMEPGMTRIAISMDPKEAMQRDGVDFWEGFGYREGLAFIQWYTKVDADTLVTGTYSIDHTDLEAFKRVWAKAGGEIPAGLSTDQWLDCAITTQCGVEQARELVKTIRNQYYRQQHLPTERYAINDFMALNQQAINQAFNELYMPMSIAHDTGRKNATIHAFVEGMLANPTALKDGTAAKLRKIYNHD